MSLLSVIVPCYNEEESVSLFISTVTAGVVVISAVVVSAGSPSLEQAANELAIDSAVNPAKIFFKFFIK